MGTEYKIWHGALDPRSTDTGEEMSQINGTYFVWLVDAITSRFGKAIIFIKYNSADIRSLTSIGGGKSCSYRNWYAIKGRHSSMR